MTNCAPLGPWEDKQQTLSVVHVHLGFDQTNLIANRVFGVC